MSAPISIAALIPELILLVAGCVVLIVGQARSHGGRAAAPWVTLISLAAALFAVLWEEQIANLLGSGSRVGNGLAYGSLAIFVRISAIELGILFTLVNWSQARESERGEYLAMMLYSLTGLLLIGPADNLLVLFLALELVSIPTYIMVVLSRTNVKALEAGTKYFYLGAMSAAIMAYGFSFLYGVTGSASISGTIVVLRDILAQPGTLQYVLAMVGILLSIGGLLFKLAAVPLHLYVADVYQGAASPVAGLLGFVPKAAGVVALMKILLLAGHWTGGQTVVFWLLWIIAAVSMTVGNLLALRQTNIKRMLAYSGVAHAGYMLVGLMAGPFAGGDSIFGGIGFMGKGTAAVLYYVVIYGIANLGAFAILGLLRNRDSECETLRDVAGLLRREPALALLFALAMFTLMGLPPTPGFWGKLGLFGSALAAAQSGALAAPSEWIIALVIIGVLNSALAAAYYLRVIAAVLLYDNDQPARAMPREAQQIGALLCGFLLLIFAFWPNGLIAQAESGTNELIDRLNAPAEVATQPPPVGSPPPLDAEVASASRR